MVPKLTLGAVTWILSLEQAGLACPKPRGPPFRFPLYINSVCMCSSVNVYFLCSNVSENDLICDVRDALPPAGSKLMYGAMHQIAMGNRSAIGAFLYPLPTELEVEILHNSTLIYVVQYLCIIFVRHGKWSVKISTYRRTVPHRYLVHHPVCITCNKVLCGYCAILSSSCQHVMTGSEIHKPLVVGNKYIHQANSSLRRQIKVRWKN